MGLDKKKPIILATSFKHDPYAIKNVELSTEWASTLPNDVNDVQLSRHQTVFESVNFILKKLLENDEYCNKFLENEKTQTKTTTQITSIYSYSAATGETYPPEQDDLDNVYANLLADHSTEYHDNSNEVLKQVESDYLNADCSNFNKESAKDNFLSTSIFDTHVNEADNITYKNDFVVKTEFDDSENVISPTNYINLAVSNKATSNIFRTTANKTEYIIDKQPSILDFKYIYQEWLSGLKDLYIFVPTTITFYNENCGREDLSKNQTFLRLTISKQHFLINHIYSIEVCGQSFPLQIHNYYGDQYDDTIQPSFVRSMCMSEDTLNNSYCVYNDRTRKYVIYICCYGSDSQAIHLTFD